MPQVLLVNTELHILAILKRKFELEGFKVITLDLPLELQMLAEVKPDLIVLGHSFELSQIRSLLQEKLPKTPIILLRAGLASEEMVIPETEQLKMPFRPSDLMAMARRVVAST
jgi:DNA-binding response OmpR family regulator